MLIWSVVYPFDIIKTTIQSDLSNKTLKQKEILLKFINDKGFFSLYNGMSTCLIRAFFVNAVFFYVNEFLENYLKNLNLKINEI
jgi:hypothetical protein